MPGPYDAYSGGVYDPYGQERVIGSEVIADPYSGYPGVVYPGAVYPGPVSSGDNFDTRGSSPTPIPAPKPQQ